MGKIDMLDEARKLMATENMPPDEQAFAGKLLEHLAKGGTLAEFFKLGAQDLEGIYAAALNYYQNAKYADAINVFRYLCLHDHLTAKWWIGLGAAQQGAREYGEALQSYNMAAILDTTDPRPPLHAGYCLLMQNRKSEAQDAFRRAMDVCGAKPEHTQAKKQASMLLGVAKNIAPKTI